MSDEKPVRLSSGHDGRSGCPAANRECTRLDRLIGDYCSAARDGRSAHARNKRVNGGGTTVILQAARRGVSSSRIERVNGRNE